MTREETLEAIKVMQHFADGGEVSMGYASAQHPSWNWQKYKYRIKEPTIKKIKLYAWLDHSGQLGWSTADSILNEYMDERWRRVPSEDKWVEVEE